MQTAATARVQNIRLDMVHAPAIVAWMLLAATASRAAPLDLPDTQLAGSLLASGVVDTGDVTFTRQDAWNLWSPQTPSAKSPNCMRARISQARGLDATFCHYVPDYDDRLPLSSYDTFRRLIPQNGVGASAAELNKVCPHATRLALAPLTN